MKTQSKQQLHPQEPPVNVRDRVIEHRKMLLSELQAHPENPRLHPDNQRKGFRGVLREIGWAGAVLAYYSERNNGALTLVDGHLRREEIQSTPVDVLITDLNDDEARKLLLFYDKLTALAEYSELETRSLLETVKTNDVSLMQIMDTLEDEINAANNKDEGKTLGDDNTVLFEQGIQLEPAKEYILIMCNNSDEFERLKEIFHLAIVRRGGYMPGSPFDDIGTERVITFDRFVHAIDQHAQRTCEQHAHTTTEANQ